MTDQLAIQFVLALVAAEFGDYVLQSDWMAQEKTKKTLAALAHVIVYTACFLVVTLDWRALAFIGVTHFAIDRWRLARYVCWAKNYLAPPYSGDPAQEHKLWWHPWERCSKTGYHEDAPPWMSVWLMIRADNAMHHACNLFAIWMWA